MYGRSDSGSVGSLPHDCIVVSIFFRRGQFFWISMTERICKNLFLGFWDWIWRSEFIEVCFDLSKAIEANEDVIYSLWSFFAIWWQGIKCGCIFIILKLRFERWNSATTLLGSKKCKSHWPIPKSLVTVCWDEMGSHSPWCFLNVDASWMWIDPTLRHTSILSKRFGERTKQNSKMCNQTHLWQQQLGLSEKPVRSVVLHPSHSAYPFNEGQLSETNIFNDKNEVKLIVAKIATGRNIGIISKRIRVLSSAIVQKTSSVAREQVAAHGCACVVRTCRNFHGIVC